MKTDPPLRPVGQGRLDPALLQPLMDEVEDALEPGAAIRPTMPAPVAKRRSARTRCSPRVAIFCPILVSVRLASTRLDAANALHIALKLPSRAQRFTVNLAMSGLHLAICGSRSTQDSRCTGVQQTRGNSMRKTMLAVAAAALAVPAIPGARPLPMTAIIKGRVWRDSHGRYRCKRPNGTTGLIVGAAGGALVGRAIDTRGERATGHDHRRRGRRADRAQDRPQPVSAADHLSFELGRRHPPPPDRAPATPLLSARAKAGDCTSDRQLLS